MAITLDGTAGITTPALINANANGVGNIGSSTTYFNTVFAKATSAQYADVAEKYIADDEYPSGTVMEIGGVNEVTISTQLASTRICGVVSSNPALIMNSSETHQYATPIALTGRVPCLVVGTIRKGDLMCSSHIPGVAAALAAVNYRPGVILGKALEDYDSTTVGTIEILVGKI